MTLLGSRLGRNDCLVLALLMTNKGQAGVASVATVPTLFFELHSSHRKLERNLFQVGINPSSELIHFVVSLVERSGNKPMVGLVEVLVAGKSWAQSVELEHICSLKMVEVFEQSNEFEAVVAEQLVELVLLANRLEHWQRAVEVRYLF